VQAPLLSLNRESNVSADSTTLPIPWRTRLRTFFGLFTLTPFEETLIDAVRERLPTELRDILDAQLSEFNYTARVLDERLDHATTCFYKMRFGRPRLALRRLFPTDKEKVQLAKVHVKTDDATIDVEFWIVRKIFFLVEFRSPQNIFYPRGAYTIASVDVFPI